MKPTIWAAQNGILHLTIEDIDAAIAAGYTKISVVQDTSSTGSFATSTGTATLVASQCGYQVQDLDATTAVYYRARLSNADGTSVGDWADVLQYGTQLAYCSAFDIRQELATAHGDASISAKHEHTLWSMARQVSRLIDHYKVVEDGAYLASGSEVRYFDGETYEIDLHDMPAASVTAVEVEETDGTWTAWSASDYWTEPYNASALSRPITRIRVSDRSTSNESAFTVGLKRVRITGVWGISTTAPELVRRACVVQVAQWWSRGQAGWRAQKGDGNFGTVIYPAALSDDVKMLLNSVYPKPGILA